MKVYFELDTAQDGDSDLIGRIAAALAGFEPTAASAPAPKAETTTAAATVTATAATTPKPDPKEEEDEKLSDDPNHVGPRAYGQPHTTSRRTKAEMAEDKEIDDLFEKVKGAAGIPKTIPLDMAASDLLAELKVIAASDEDAPEQSGEADAPEQSGDEEEPAPVTTHNELRAVVLKANKVLPDGAAVAILKEYGSGLSKIDESDIPEVAAKLRAAMAEAA